MSEHTKQFPVSWGELHRDGKALAWRLLEQGHWHGVIAITRGGMVPAAVVARELEIRVIDTLCLASYVDDRQGQLEVLKAAPAADSRGRGWVIVDDLVDTGATADKARELLPQAHLATVFAKPKGLPTVDTFITEVSQDTWILFPWDTEPQAVAPIARTGGRPR